MSEEFFKLKSLNLLWTWLFNNIHVCFLDPTLPGVDGAIIQVGDGAELYCADYADRGPAYYTSAAHDDESES